MKRVAERAAAREPRPRADLRIYERRCEREADTAQLAASVARALDGELLRAALHVHLHGVLGAGKTTWVRAALRALGVEGTIRSPTYSLVEVYETPRRRCIHVDLYRVMTLEELEPLGLADEDRPGSIWFVEWPERGAAWLPAAELDVTLRLDANAGRLLRLQAGTEAVEGALSRALGEGDR